MKMGFIGIGRMAEVILRSILRSGVVKPSEVMVSRRDRRALQRLSKELKVRITTQNEEVARHSSLVFIGVKPFQAHQVLSSLKLHPGTMVLSMMAGISTQFLRRHLGRRCKIVRIMPNTPALVGEGITGVYFSKNLSKAERRLIQKILQPLGPVLICSAEESLDTVTGLSGSGVAFIYRLTQGLMDGGRKGRLSYSQVKSLALQTLMGAARMMEVTGASPEQLIAKVTSKGGTTERGMKVLNRRKSSAALAEAVQQATQRAREIRKEHDRCRP